MSDVGSPSFDLPPRASHRAAGARSALLHPRGVLTVTAALFVALSLFAALIGVFPADAEIRDALLSVASPPVVSTMRVVNAAGDWRVLLPGTLLLLALPRARRHWWLWALLMLAGTVLPDGFKLLIGRPRPDAASLGFPSGHAAAAATFFGAVAYLAGSFPGRACQLARLGAFILIALVGVARVVLRAHWPSDVVGGIALGLALASMAALIDAARPGASRPRD
jgi:undecaprenyl-diphosphatase